MESAEEGFLSHPWGAWKAFQEEDSCLHGEERAGGRALMKKGLAEEEVLRRDSQEEGSRCGLGRAGSGETRTSQVRAAEPGT